MASSKAEREFHRKTAAMAFNRTWSYLDKKNRSPADDAQMLHLAHTSRYHWGLVGTPRNRAVGDWQISRVYASLGQPELALRYARLSLSTCKKNGLAESVPAAYEAIARAYATAKDTVRAEDYLAKARQLLDKLPLEKEDRRIFLGQINDTRRLIKEL